MLTWTCTVYSYSNIALLPQTISLPYNILHASLPCCLLKCETFTNAADCLDVDVYDLNAIQI